MQKIKMIIIKKFSPSQCKDFECISYYHSCCNPIPNLAHFPICYAFCSSCELFSNKQLFLGGTLCLLSFCWGLLETSKIPWGFPIRRSKDRWKETKWESTQQLVTFFIFMSSVQHRPVHLLSVSVDQCTASRTAQIPKLPPMWILLLNKVV